VGQTTVHAGNARQVMVVGISMNDVAENDVTNVFGIDSGTVDGFPHTDCGHLAGRGILKAAAVPGDCRSNSAKNYNFSIHMDGIIELLTLEELVFALTSLGRPHLPRQVGERSCFEVISIRGYFNQVLKIGSPPLGRYTPSIGVSFQIPH
jgi:hypothetical protein